MMSPRATLILLYISTFMLALANFDCITRTSSRSGTSDDDTTWVECNTYPYITLVSCGYKPYVASDSNADGSKVIGDTCYAQNGANGKGVYAVARCCDFTHIPDLECIAIDTQTNTGDDMKKSITCAQYGHQFLTGCTVSSPYSCYDGGYPGTKNPLDGVVPNSNYYLNGYCTGVNGEGNGFISSVHLMCCDSPSYALQCVIRYGSVSGSTKESSTYCASGYQMTGCVGFGNYAHALTTWFISGDICYSRSSSTSMPVIAVAICCKLETSPPTKFPTESPSFHPTIAPSISPSNIPTKSPSVNPTINPTNIPTQSPSSNPTMHPTIIPTKRPSMLPSGPPTQHPTLSPFNIPTRTPSLYPTMHPTVGPSMLPSGIPTKAPTLSEDSTLNPTLAPISFPTASPTRSPTVIEQSIPPTDDPTRSSTNSPAITLTPRPADRPTKGPTSVPIIHTADPTRSPLKNGETHDLTGSPLTKAPTVTHHSDTLPPSEQPSAATTDDYETTTTELETTTTQESETTEEDECEEDEEDGICFDAVSKKECKKTARALRRALDYSNTHASDATHEKACELCAKVSTSDDTLCECIALAKDTLLDSIKNKLSGWLQKRLLEYCWDSDDCKKIADVKVVGDTCECAALMCNDIIGATKEDRGDVLESMANMYPINIGVALCIGFALYSCAMQ